MDCDLWYILAGEKKSNTKPSRISDTWSTEFLICGLYVSVTSSLKMFKSCSVTSFSEFWSLLKLLPESPFRILLALNTWPIKEEQAFAHFILVDGAYPPHSPVWFCYCVSLDLYAYYQLSQLHYRCIINFWVFRKSFFWVCGSYMIYAVLYLKLLLERWHLMFFNLLRLSSRIQVGQSLKTYWYARFNQPDDINALSLQGKTVIIHICYHVCK